MEYSVVGAKEEKKDVDEQEPFEEGGDRSPTTWKDWLFRVSALLMAIQVISIPLIKVIDAAIYISYLIIPLFLYSIACLLYYFYRAFKSEADKRRTMWSIITFVTTWMLGCIYVIWSLLGDFRWGHVGNAIDLGHLDTLLWQGFENSYLVGILLQIPIMLAFRSKRNANSVVNTVLYWSISMGFVVTFLLMALSDAQ